MSEQHKTGDQRQPAATGHDERHAGAFARILPVPPVTDQQERRQAGQLPENQQQDQIVRKDNTKHRPLKQQQIGIKAPDGIVTIEIEPRIDDDQQANDQDHRGEEKAQSIEAEREIQPDLRNPCQADALDAAGKNGFRTRQQQRQRRKRHKTRSIGANIAARADEKRRQDRAEQRQKGNKPENHQLIHAPDGTVEIVTAIGNGLGIGRSITALIGVSIQKPRGGPTCAILPYQSPARTPKHSVTKHSAVVMQFRKKNQIWPMEASIQMPQSSRIP